MATTGRAVIVTGSSRGIGAATAILAASRGYSVCVNFVASESAAMSVVQTIEKAGGKAIARRADVSDERQVVELFDSAERSLGPLYGLVNNAAILERQCGFSELSPARLERIFRTNVIGAFLCAKEAIARMSASGAGAIVNVSSCAAKTGSPHEYVDYAMSKGALDTMTVGLAKEVAADGIRVNAVRPGFIETDMHAAGGEPDRVERLRDSIPLKRGGTPEEAASAIVWLLSADSSYCTGSFIDVAGGVA